MAERVKKKIVDGWVAVVVRQGSTYGWSTVLPYMIDQPELRELWRERLLFDERIVDKVLAGERISMSELYPDEPLLYITSTDQDGLEIVWLQPDERFWVYADHNGFETIVRERDLMVA